MTYPPQLYENVST